MSKNNLNKNSREAFLKDLYGENSEADWEKAAQDREPWALKKKLKTCLKSSLLEERDQAEDLEQMLQKSGYPSRKEKLAMMKNGGPKKSLFFLTADAKKVELAEKITGCTLVVHKNPKQGLEDLKSNKYDVVVIDFELPIANGLQFLNTVRASEDWNVAAPIVMITKQVSSAMVKHGKNLKVSRWLMEKELDENLDKTIKDMVA